MTAAAALPVNLRPGRLLCQPDSGSWRTAAAAARLSPGHPDTRPERRRTRDACPASKWPGPEVPSLRAPLNDPDDFTTCDSGFPALCRFVLSSHGSSSSSQAGMTVTRRPSHVTLRFKFRVITCTVPASDRDWRLGPGGQPDHDSLRLAGPGPARPPWHWHSRLSLAYYTTCHGSSIMIMAFDFPVNDSAA